MAKKEELKLIAAYLLTLAETELLFVLNLMAGGVHTETGGACDPPCSGKGSTANGHWVCNNGACSWVPDIG